jgi:hypothetical protein
MVDKTTLPECRERCQGEGLRDERPDRAVTEANARRVHTKPPRGVWMLQRGAKQPFAERRWRAESHAWIHADVAIQKTTEPRVWGLTRPS